ncbi:MAG: hypothetical protein KGQ59_05270, partial [Bdellovibrionales bacterium]|nr:hypothetical protein [Bdellovibrionales bacterium]
SCGNERDGRLEFHPLGTREGWGMKKVYVPLIAISGFLMVWLGLSPEAENWPQPITDTLALSHAQAERAEASDAKTSDPKSSEVKTTEAKESEVTPPQTAQASIPACLPTQALADINQRKKTLEEREASIQAREQELTVREKVLEERMKTLQGYRAEASKVDASKKKEFEEKISRTVELLESMAPKAASQLISTTDERLAVEAMSRMSTAKLSKIMNIMEPKRSVRLMELLSGNGTPVAVDSSRVVPETNPKKEEKL